MQPTDKHRRYPQVETDKVKLYQHPVPGKVKFVGQTLFMSNVPKHQSFLFLGTTVCKTEICLSILSSNLRNALLYTLHFKLFSQQVGIEGREVKKGTIKTEQMGTWETLMSSACLDHFA